MTRHMGTERIQTGFHAVAVAGVNTQGVNVSIGIIVLTFSVIFLVFISFIFFSDYYPSCY